MYTIVIAKNKQLVDNFIFFNKESNIKKLNEDGTYTECTI